MSADQTDDTESVLAGPGDDEPVVVDNPGATIDFRQPSTITPNADEVSRGFTKFKTLVVVQVTGGKLDIVPYPLDSAAPVHMEFVDPNSGGGAIVSYSVDSSNPKEIKLRVRADALRNNVFGMSGVDQVPAPAGRFSQVPAGHHRYFKVDRHDDAQIHRITQGTTLDVTLTGTYRTVMIIPEGL